MIKKLLLAIMIALPMSVFAQKFGIINTQQVMETMPEIKTVQEQMEASSKKYQTEFDNLQAEFKKKYEEFQALEESTPQAIRDRRLQAMFTRPRLDWQYGHGRYRRGRERSHLYPWRYRACRTRQRHAA